LNILSQNYVLSLNFVLHAHMAQMHKHSAERNHIPDFCFFAFTWKWRISCTEELVGIPSGHIGITTYTENRSLALILLTIFNANSIGTKWLAPVIHLNATLFFPTRNPRIHSNRITSLNCSILIGRQKIPYNTPIF
jgi:hypothetical protein